MLMTSPGTLVTWLVPASQEFGYPLPSANEVEKKEPLTARVRLIFFWHFILSYRRYPCYQAFDCFLVDEFLKSYFYHYRLPLSSRSSPI